MGILVSRTIPWNVLAEATSFRMSANTPQQMRGWDDKVVACEGWIKNIS